MEVEIRLGSVRYPFRLGTDCLGAIVEDLVAMSASRLLIVCDSNTGPLFGAELVERLSPRVPANLLIHRAGEPYKDLQAVGTLADSALQLGADRASVVVAVGGGVIGNIAGLMAALLFRGIRLVHIPTSLIAMSDSVLSLKQAVNACVGKNLMGTFYAPESVLADTAMLRSLPFRETVSGLCEVVKNSLAIRPSMVEMLRTSLRQDAVYDDETMYEIISESILAKASVTEDDMHECRAGLVLEYGHTVGHAIEYTAAGGLSHGQAIGLGMVVAAEVSHRLGHLDQDAVALHRELLTRAGAMVTIPEEVDLDEVMHRLRFDNKRGYLADPAESSAMVLLGGLGEPLWHDGRPLVSVPMALVGEVVNEIARPEIPNFELVAPVETVEAGRVPDTVGAADG
ncbi:2-deoxy-scyllo-inosose synthase [Micromonospora echinospora]